MLDGRAFIFDSFSYFSCLLIWTWKIFWYFGKIVATAIYYWIIEVKQGKYDLKPWPYNFTILSFHWQYGCLIFIVRYIFRFLLPHCYFSLNDTLIITSNWHICIIYTFIFVICAGFLIRSRIISKILRAILIFHLKSFWNWNKHYTKLCFLLEKKNDFEYVFTVFCHFSRYFFE